ncbi:hypothetical protein [Bacillus cereus]|uniref:hypothetical protein n=1 Tax=Bacillus cereus TaxID=1396 RepID=UPI000BF478A3|nr:hypothetical protein [Bacillus cereus]PFV38975.1 hypothetical protein COL00_27840 [Bacillus cereus]PGQ14718.1 hypothetical protein COA09_10145 [Bacillus cereus]PGS50308.1 hypothetical protein COC67_26810 [Bacillus cereus]PGU98345.1 hypothetical protein COD77_26345 [Bacillus cereus]
MEQIKMLEVFGKSGLSKLNKIFGPDNIVYLPKSSLAGIKYDYNNNKLQYIMEKIPFSHTQQFIVTPNKFADIILNLCSKGYKPNCKLFHTEIDLHDLKSFNSKMQLMRQKPNSETKNALLDELYKLEKEYGTFIEALSFFIGNERITIQANGILFSNGTPLEITDDLFTTH